MKVVFIENVPSVANAGDVKEVKDGYGRNYLFPRKLAMPATATALKQLEQQHQSADRKTAKLEAEAERLAGELEGKTIPVMVKAGAGGRLYGSVTNADIADQVEKVTKHPIDRRRIQIEDPVRRLGEYPVTVRLSSEHSATITIDVRAEGDEPAKPVKAKTTRKPRAKAAKPAESEDVAEITEPA